MSFNVTASGFDSISELENAFRAGFTTQYPEPAEGVEHAFGEACDEIEYFHSSVNQGILRDAFQWAGSVSGHVKQGDDDTANDSITVTLSQVKKVVAEEGAVEEVESAEPEAAAV